MKKRIRQWFNKRSPHQDHFGLGIHTVYVFFSKQGLLYLLLLIFTFVLGTNYANNLVLGLFFYLGSVWLVSAIVTFLQLSRLNFELIDVSLAPAYGIAWVQIAISSDSGTPARQIRLNFDYDPAHLAQLSPADQAFFKQHQTHTLSAVQAKTEIRLPILTNKRGVASLPRLNIASTYPLGITQAWSYGFFARPSFVYPVPKAFDGNVVQSPHFDETGVGGISIAGTDDFDRLDSYQQGENLARVSWGHLARGAGMLTKHFGDTVSPSQVLDYYAMPSLHHEDKLSELSHLLTHQSPHTPFALKLPSATSGLGAGKDFIQDCLIRLAKEP